MSELLEKYINEHKDGWYAQGKEEGKAEGRTEGIEEGRKEGRKEGKAEGRIEGAADKANQIALALVQNGFPVEAIANSTGLSVDEVNGLKESCKD